MPSQRQLSALKYLVFNARNGTDLSKRILAFLIEKSDNFSKEVCLTLTEGKDEYTGEEIQNAALGTHSMRSCNGTTHIHALLVATGVGFDFNEHYGDFDPSRTGDPFNTDGQFAGLSLSQVSKPGLIREGMPTRYTFWLSRKSYSRTAQLVTVTREELEQIDLEKPGLYPEIERSHALHR